MASRNPRKNMRINTYPSPLQLDRVVGLAMLILASTVFAYYTVWTLLMVSQVKSSQTLTLSSLLFPFYNPQRR